jgi:hypothetical protein
VLLTIRAIGITPIKVQRKVASPSQSPEAFAKAKDLGVWIGQLIVPPELVLHVPLILIFWTLAAKMTRHAFLDSSRVEKR